MANFKGKFESVRQDWVTPPELFDAMNQEFRFTLDVAANFSTKKTPAFISESEDAMKVTWGDNVCWLNPPLVPASVQLQSVPR